MLRPNAASIVELARRSALTLGAAESLTGGAVSAAMTATAGASAAWRGAVVAYDADVKHAVLGVPLSIIDSEGVVSRDTALAMARGARSTLGVDVAVATTGVAGPESHGGRTAGTVVVAVVGPLGSSVEEFHFSGGRPAVISQTVDAALRALFFAVGGLAPEQDGNGEQL
jgi:nicotinamide-nucleotide amidase